MEKSKLFEDVHVSVPSFHKPPSVLNQGSSVAVSALSLPGAVKNHRAGALFFACGIACLVGAAAFSLSTSSTKPKVIMVKAPAALAAQSPEPTAITPTVARALANQGAQIISEKNQIQALEAEIARLNTQTRPVATTPAPQGLNVPVSIDQHGVVLTINGRAFQCSAREGSPVCVDVGGYQTRYSQRGT